MALPDSYAFNQFQNPGSPEKAPLVGLDLASAVTIVPTGLITYITGTAEIDNITLPWLGFSGFIILVFAGAATFATGGNIGKAGTATAAQAIMFVYHSVKGLWYPVKF